MIHQKFRRLFHKIPQSTYFPIIIGFVVIVLSGLQISGTSMGVYDYLFGADTDNQIAGQPRSIRSDEWAVNTPFVIAQSTDNYPIHNTDIGVGQDMSVVIDVPYWDWSIIFRPQNLVFFIAPLGVAFALKWWLLLAVLLVAVYLFILLLYPKRYVLASLLAAVFAFNPFIQWWYQTITILPIAYGLLLIVATFGLLRARETARAILWSLLLSYLAICFVLLMYPAFQISAALVSLAVIVAILFAKKEFVLLKRRRTLILIACAGVVSASVTGLFILQHIDAIRTALSTIYPGSRAVTSGGLDPATLTSWIFSYLLLDSQTANVFRNNQSESSNFLLLGFVVLPFLGILWLKYKNKCLSKLETVLAASMSVLGVFILWRMFIPAGDQLFALFGLSKVPHPRLFIALGMINLVLLAICIGRRAVAMQSPRQLFNKYHLLIFTACLVIYATIAIFTIQHFNISVVGWKECLLVIAVFSVTTTLLLSTYSQPRYVGLGLMCLVALATSGLANPLYRNLSITSSPLTQYIKEIEAHNNDYWISNDQPYLSSIILASGAELQGGVNTYPQLSMWNEYFPGKESVYNRYAHIRYKIDHDVKKPSMDLIQADSFRITLNSCDPLLKTLRIRYIVSDISLGNTLPCYPKYDTRSFDKKNLHIYYY